MLKILIVDDEAEITEILQRFFQGKNYTVFTANNGPTALDIVKAQRPHVVFLDICMPGLDGVAVLRDISALDSSIKVVMITALEDELKMLEAKSAGAVDYIRKPFNLEYLEHEVVKKINVKLFEDFRQQLNEKGELIKQLAQELTQIKKLTIKIKENFYQTILSLAKALESRDRYTHGHSERVAFYSNLIAKELKRTKIAEIDEAFLEALDIESHLHDIGKIAVPDVVLNKQGNLTEEEYCLIKMHPVEGTRILIPLEGAKDNIEVIYSHHERFDGNGYPDRKAGETIPLRARIIAVADCFDAMTSDRPYRKAMEVNIAFLELEKNKNTQFDRIIVDAFSGAYKKL